MKHQNIAIIGVGAGYFSQFHYDAWQRIPEVTLVGTCDNNLEQARACAQQYDIPAYTDDLAKFLKEYVKSHPTVKEQPLILDVITPSGTHLNYVTIAAQYGLDVICQKPFGESIEQAKQMIDIAKAANIQLIVHENFRFMPWYRHIKNIIGHGFIGELLEAQYNLRPGDGQGDQAYLSRQPYFQKMEKFLIHETGIHFIDTFRFLFGEVSNVFAKLRRCNSVIQGEDAGILIFELANNAQATFNGNRLLDHGCTNLRRTMGEMLIEGTAGSIYLDGNADIWLRAFGEEKGTQYDYKWNDSNFGGDCVYEFNSHIVRHYLEEGPLETSAQDYLRNLVIENAVYQSSKEKRVIEVAGD